MRNHLYLSGRIASEEVFRIGRGRRAIGRTLAIIVLCAYLCTTAFISDGQQDVDAILRFGSGSLEGWTVEGKETWRISLNPAFFRRRGYSRDMLLTRWKR